MDFDEAIDRRGTHCVKWDMMEAIYGVPAADGLAMWVADMEFRPPSVVQRALEAMTAHGVYGYFGDDRPYRDAIRWWMRERHGWEVAPEAILTTHGLVNAVGLAVDVYTAPGDAVVLFTPVYHAFARVIRAAGRTVTECPLRVEDGRHVMDFAAYEALLTGRERMVILCSPHNPGGRVWSRAELEAVAAFARRPRPRARVRRDPPRHRHAGPPPRGHGDAAGRGRPAGHADGDHQDLQPRGRAHGQRHHPRPGPARALRRAPGLAGPVAQRLRGAHGDRRLLARGGGLGGRAQPLHRRQPPRPGRGLHAIPGVRSMALEATYLAWVDFNGLGMAPGEVQRRIERDARVAVNHGPSFGTGGEGWMRVNLGAPRAQVAQAVARLQAAFADVQ
jgi:cystathionine beta-lyase